MAAGYCLRTIEPGERDAVLDLLAGWLNDRGFFARYFRYDPAFRDDLCFVATDGGRIVSTLQVFRKTVRADGAALAVAGVGNVYTDPSYRGAGVASALLERACAAMREHGFDISLLFATRLEFYSRLGWRSHLRHLSFIDANGAAPVLRTTVEPFEAERDLEAVIAVYDAYNGAVAGSTIRDRAYWLGQLRYAGNPGERAVVARDAGRVVAYARGTALYGFNAVIEHGCAPGAEAALADLVCHLHHAGAGLPGTIAQLVPSAHLEALLVERGLSVQRVDDRFWMWRVVDPERLAATLRVPVAVAAAADLLDQILPAARSRYWLSDRF